MKRMSHSGFTLIELLIVVAIIAILAAIAVPNFLEAQTRARISACMGDHRTLDIALNAYRVDTGKVPYTDVLTAQFRLTSPVAYLSTAYWCAHWDRWDKWYGVGTSYGNNIIAQYGMIPQGIYCRKWYNDIYNVLGTAEGTTVGSGPWIYETNFRVFAPEGQFLMMSQGPRGGNAYQTFNSPPGYGYIWFPYDPTNGTVSGGNIIRMDGGVTQGQGGR